MTPLAFAVLLAAVPCAAQTSGVEGAVPGFEQALADVRADRKALSIRGDRWDTALTLPQVEALLADPLQAPARLSAWDKSMASARSLTGLMALARELSPGGTSYGQVEPLKVKDVSGLPPEAEKAVRGILEAMAAAKPLVDRAAASLSPEERRLALSTLEAMLVNEDAQRKEPEALRLAARVDAGLLLEAGRGVAEAVERALPVLRAEAPKVKPMSKRRFRQAFGDVVVSGPGDDVYTAQDLKDAALVLDFGGDNSYRGDLAAAGPGELRVAIDLGRNVSVEAKGSTACAGAGLLGVGLLYMPEDGGRKTIVAGDFSLGAGLLGVGAAHVRGSGNRLQGGRFSSGAGAFGLGVLLSEGEGVSLSADLAAQGFGFTRGTGLFSHRGSAARLDCGLRYPDGREALALLSLCQGMGQGPRAFAAGGVGLAYVEGDGSALTGSYFAQGSGYWHGLGALFLHGRKDRLQARRYGQGAGVHTALGALVLDGDEDELRTWGVGPGFGWDYGVGFFLGRGDGNLVSADWAAGRGDINGHGLLFLRGRGNRLALGDLGTGALKRGAPSYGLAVLDGEKVSFKPAEPSPWGRVRGGEADPKLSPSEASWPEADRQLPAQQAWVRNQLRLARSKDLPFEGRAETWLSVLSDGGLDQAAPAQTAVDILGLEPEEGAGLARFVVPERFDELVWLRTLLPAFGEPAAKALEVELAASAGMRKAVLLGTLASFGATRAAGQALAAVSDPDWRVRRAAVASLGGLFDREDGEEPGRLRALEAARLAVDASSGTEASRAEEAVRLLGARRLPELLSVLGLDPGAPSRDKVGVFQKAGSPFDRLGAGTEGIREFVRVLQSRPMNYGDAVRRELAESAALEGGARAAALKALADPEPEVAHAAVVAVGQLGNPSDAVWLAGFLKSDSSLLREAAAAALGKMGAGAEVQLGSLFAGRDPRQRSLAVLAAAQSGDARLLRLVKVGLRDSRPEVRRDSVGALFAVQDPYKPRRKDFLEELRRLEASDPNPEVRAAAGRAADLLSH